MWGNADRRWWRERAPVAAALIVLAVAASGCSGSSLFGGPSAAAPSPQPAAAPAPASSHPGWLRSEWSALVSGPSTSAPQQVAGATPDVECPYLQIRDGASTLSIRAPGDNAAMSLRYQGTFVRGARQCSVIGGQMVMKIGIEGRIILGPAGGPGQVMVPLRLAVVDQTPAATKIIITKLIMIPVMVQSATDNPVFTHVEDGLTFPLPSPASALEHYIVYIGFDPLAAEAQTKPEKPTRKPRRKVKPKLRLAPTG